MFNVGFLNRGVTRACLNAVGKMPVRRDVLMKCVSAGKSVGEIAWRMCEGIGSRGHVVGWLEISHFSVLPLPLSFARSCESKGCPNSCFDRGVGLREGVDSP